MLYGAGEGSGVLMEALRVMSCHGRWVMGLEVFARYM